MDHNVGITPPVDYMLNKILRNACSVLQQMSSSSLDCSNLSVMANYGWSDVRSSADTSCDDNMQCDNLFGIHPFYIATGEYCTFP